MESDLTSTSFVLSAIHLKMSHQRSQASIRRRRRSERESALAEGDLAMITLPSTLTENLSPQQLKEVSRVQFNFYSKTTLFQVPVVCSPFPSPSLSSPHLSDHSYISLFSFFICLGYLPPSLSICLSIWLSFSLSFSLSLSLSLSLLLSLFFCLQFHVVCQSFVVFIGWIPRPA